ncbi:MAG: replicative DNA helicase [Cytophagaceae bacterium]|nr:replicative DNA helicase [Cytophagaceae bacterium]MBK9933577.1 replicative DNA helicase [Cytophagaceae bacterium]MBL0302710.1 replicative DNA helicase [Cytophagaceae bacterium]MBL0325533.1 replicative DNA helicase [Cytophagaceae bacterium]
MKQQRRRFPDNPKRNPEQVFDFQQASHIVELEAMVLGGVIKERDALTSVIDVLKSESFISERHQAIYQAILSLFGKSEPVDLLTVTNQLRQTGELEFIGGATYLAKITSKGTSTHIEQDARIIVQYAMRRSIIKIMDEVVAKAYEDTTDVYNLLDSTEQGLREIQEGNLNKNIPELSSVVLKTIQELRNKSEQDAGVASVPSGFPSLDRVTGGWHNTELIIIAARPGMGKTAFVVSALRNAAIDFKMPVALFSLEMSSQQVMLRLISAEAEIDSQKLRKGELDNEDWQALHSKLNDLAISPIYIDDTPALSVLELRTKARRLKAFHNIKLLIVDYLQLMTAGNGRMGMNREQEIAAISRSLKTIAKELNIPVIALSQLSRSVETRAGDKRPQLSDLRESGSIEQDADVVMFLYRPEYYNITESETGESTKGTAEVIIAKNRSGSVDTVNLRFVGKYTRFSEFDGFSLSKEKYEEISGTKVFGSKANDI